MNRKRIHSRAYDRMRGHINRINGRDPKDKNEEAKELGCLYAQEVAIKFDKVFENDHPAVD